jgi:GTP:adenosylcobinamide-phosphate guanylyltransferase
VQRVIEALSASQSVSGGVLCGPVEEVFRNGDEFERILANTEFTWLAPAAGPSASAVKAVQSLDRYPVLLTTGDHALLTPQILDDFCRQALETGADIVAGLAPWPLVHDAFPASKRTVQHYSDGAFCGTNLFALLNASGLAALEFWETVEAQRKQPWKIARKLGVGFLSRFLLRQISLSQAILRLSQITSCKVSVVQLNAARAAVDVDSVADQQLAESILEQEA